MEQLELPFKKLWKRGDRVRILKKSIGNLSRRLIHDVAIINEVRVYVYSPHTFIHSSSRPPKLGETYYLIQNQYFAEGDFEHAI